MGFKGQKHLLVMYQFVHSSWAKSCSDSVHNSTAGIDVADKLRFALAGVCPIFEQNNLGLLQASAAHIRYIVYSSIQAVLILGRRPSKNDDTSQK